MSDSDSCPVCGRTLFTFGHLRDLGPVVFTTADRGSGSLLKPKGKRVNARLCETCGNVQLFAVRPFNYPKEKPKRG